MQKPLALSFLFLAGISFSTGLVSAQTLTITSGTTTTTQTLNANHGSLTISNGATLQVSGTGTAVLFADSTSGDSLSVSNSGTVNQNGTGIAFGDGNGHDLLTINNMVGGKIEAANGEALEFTKSSTTVTLNNQGTVTSNGASNQAVDFNGVTTGTSTLKNFSTGFIQSDGADAVRPGVNGIVENSGTITVIDVPGSSSDGIDAQKNSGAVIINDDATDTGTSPASGALIQGARHGITGGNTTGTAFFITVTNNANGTIRGMDGSGINIDGVSTDNGVTIAETGTITNLGTITGDGTTQDGDGVDVDGNVVLTNGSATNKTATIKSISSFDDTSEGVTVGGGTINNYGLIQGSVDNSSGMNTAVGRGITLAGVDHNSTGSFPIQSIYSNTTVTNYSTGRIIGDTDSGITIEGNAVAGHTPYTLTINNAGLIQGGGATVAAIEAQMNGVNQGIAPNNMTIVNTGTITDSASGKAIDFGNGNNSLTVQGGTASIVGNITGGTGTNAITIDPGQGNTFSYAGSMSNISSVLNKSGTVIFSGASTYTGTTTISGGTTYVTNAADSGSATGSGEVDVQGRATFGGSGTVAPGMVNSVAKGVKLEANATLISGVIPATGVTTAGTGLTLDNRTAGGVILDASVGSANLTFLLGSGATTGTSFDFTHPETNSSFLTVLGNAKGEVLFQTGDTITLQDISDGSLDLAQHIPYLLISTGAIDNSDFAGLQTTGLSLNGNPGNGYVTNVAVQFAGAKGPSQSLELYLNNGQLEVVPEPGTWVLLAGSLGLIALLKARCRQRD